MYRKFRKYRRLLKLCVRPEFWNGFKMVIAYYLFFVPVTAYIFWAAVEVTGYAHNLQVHNLTEMEKQAEEVIAWAGRGKGSELP